MALNKLWTLGTILGITGLLLSLHCSYSFSGATLPPHIKTVGVPLFQNRSPEFGIDQALTDAVISAITKDNTLKIADPSTADALLHGTLLRVEDRAGQYDEMEKASTFQVVLTVEVTFEDTQRDLPLWHATFTQFGTYTDNRDEGIAQAIEKLTLDIVNRMVSSW